MLQVCLQSALGSFELSIKEIKCLGDGNFGKVILALTVGLSKQDLKLEGEATHTLLVAVKKLKDNLSEMNRQMSH